MRLFVYIAPSLRYFNFMKSASASPKQKPVFFLQLLSSTGYPLVATGTQLSVRTEKGVKKLKLPKHADLSIAEEGTRTSIYDGNRRLASLKRYESLIADSGVPGATPQVYVLGSRGFYPESVSEGTQLILAALSPEANPKPFKQGSFEAALEEECIDRCDYLLQEKDGTIDLGVPAFWQSDPLSALKVSVGQAAASTFMENIWGQCFYVFHGLASSKANDPQLRTKMLSLLKFVPSGVQNPNFTYPQPIEGGKNGLFLLVSGTSSELKASDCFDAVKTITQQIGKELTGDREYLLTKGMLKILFSYIHETAKVLFWMATMRDKMKSTCKAG